MVNTAAVKGVVVVVERMCVAASDGVVERMCVAAMMVWWIGCVQL